MLVLAVSENILYDVIVVGGGPGGSAAAAFLGRKGRRVLLLDKETWPRDKTCGDAISGKSIGLLAELGLTDQLERSEHGEISGLTFSSPNGKVLSLPLRKNAGEIKKGYVCRRLVYDNIIWNAAKSCSDAVEGAAVYDLVRENGRIAGVKVRMRDGTEREYLGKLVIGADGANSLVAQKVRGPEVDPDHTCVAYRAYYSGIAGMNSTLEIHFVRSIMPGYFWIFPLENGLANVGIGMVMRDMRKNGVNLQKAMFDIIEQNPLFKDRFAVARQVSQVKAWSLPFGSKKRKVHGAGVMLVGDAAGLVDPFSGEGVGNALLSGKLAATVADLALEAGDYSESFLSRYEEMLWGAIWNELSISYAMQKFGKMEWLLNFVINKAATSERAREAISGTFSSSEAKKGYASPLFYLRLLIS